MADKPKTISKEAAKLLGFPFKWDRTVPMKYIREAKGCRLLTLRDGVWVDEQDAEELFDLLCANTSSLPYVVEDPDENNQS